MSKEIYSKTINYEKISYLHITTINFSQSISNINYLSFYIICNSQIWLISCGVFVIFICIRFTPQLFFLAIKGWTISIPTNAFTSILIIFLATNRLLLVNQNPFTHQLHILWNNWLHLLLFFVPYAICALSLIVFLICWITKASSCLSFLKIIVFLSINVL